MRKYLEQGGTKFDKWSQVDAIVSAQFQQWIEKGIESHDWDIRECALKAAREAQLPDFKASDHWLYLFKKRHFIVDRMGTRFITPKTPKEREDLREAERKFIAETREKMIGRPLSMVFTHSFVKTDEFNE